MRTFLAITVLVAVLVSQTATTPAPAADLPVKPKAENEFDKLGANCTEASDGCRTYTRAADGKYDAAGNIGISCQPKAPVCTKRR